MQTWNKRRLINTLAIFIIAGVMVYLIGSGHLPRKQQNETKNIQGFAFDTTYQITAARKRHCKSVCRNVVPTKM